MTKYAVTMDDVVAFDDLVRLYTDVGYVRDDVLPFICPIDPQTGLPSLPEGYFWRVFEEYGPWIGLFFREEQTVEKEIRYGFLNRKVRTETTTVVVDRFIRRYHIDLKFSDPVVQISDAAVWLLRTLPGHLLEETSALNLDAYLGDYPPKSLLTD